MGNSNKDDVALSKMLASRQLESISSAVASHRLFGWLKALSSRHFRRNSNLRTLPLIWCRDRAVATTHTPRAVLRLQIETRSAGRHQGTLWLFGPGTCLPTSSKISFRIAGSAAASRGIGRAAAFPWGKSWSSRVQRMTILYHHEHSSPRCSSWLAKGLAGYTRRKMG